MPFETTQPQVL